MEWSFVYCQGSKYYGDQKLVWKEKRLVRWFCPKPSKQTSTLSFNITTSSHAFHLHQSTTTDRHPCNYPPTIPFPQITTCQGVSPQRNTREHREWAGPKLQPQSGSPEHDHPSGQRCLNLTTRPEARFAVRDAGSPKPHHLATPFSRGPGTPISACRTQTAPAALPMTRAE